MTQYLFFLLIAHHVVTNTIMRIFQLFIELSKRLHFAWTQSLWREFFGWLIVIYIEENIKNFHYGRLSVNRRKKCYPSG